MTFGGGWGDRGWGIGIPRGGPDGRVGLGTPKRKD